MLPRNVEITLLLVLSATCLVLGLTLPTVTLKELVFWKHTFSVLSGIESLYLEKQYFLAVLVLFFSVVFPVVKLAVLGLVWFAGFPQEKRLKLLRLIGSLGKWSMADVFVVAIFIVITKLSGFLSAKAHWGIYLFASSAILSIFTTIRVGKYIRSAGL